MTDPKYRYSRREFFRLASAAGAGATLSSGFAAAGAAAADEPVRVATRPFGSSGFDVSILSLGGMFDIRNNQLLLKQAVRMGVTYWDTADCYGGGASEEGIGRYFSRNPAGRNRIFLVSKSDARDPDGMTRLLNRSLKRMNTEVVDLYLVHAVRNPRELDDRTRRWAEKTKAQGKIRLFGFSTHSNMEHCMMEASRLGWIDGIMMTYNFRLMHTAAMKEAVAACSEAGIGLTAMKTQGGGQIRRETSAESALAASFLERGFTDAQAKLKAVWENPAIASICSQMPNMTYLMANVAAAVDRTRLSFRQRDLLKTFDRQTASGYCAGCTDLCESALAEALPVGEVMRGLMYARSYGEPDRARRLLESIPTAVRRRLETADYAEAERRCPRNMSIGRLMKEAVRELA